MNRPLARLASLALALFAAAAHAQSWPSKPIRVIVPFTAGSGTDTIARPVLAEMSRLLGQTIVVENRPGAGGSGDEGQGTGGTEVRHGDLRAPVKTGEML